MYHLSDDERRRRLASRHGLAPAARHRDPLAATGAMTALHATDAASVYMSLVARVEDLTVADVDGALYDTRSLVKQLAMRRTIFVFGRDLLPAAWASAAARTAGMEQRKIAKDLVDSRVTEDGEAWLDVARAEVLLALAEGPLSAGALKVRVPLLKQTVTLSPGTKWGGEFAVAPRILAWMGARADLVRGRNDGGWWVSRPVWSRMDQWLGSGIGGGSEQHAGSFAHQAERPADLSMHRPDSPADGFGRDEAWGYRELVRRWLWTFGPGTETDIVWWLGSTKSTVRRALAELGAAQVLLDSGGTGWVLPDDLEPTADPGHWAALLPALDPTTMGWKQRDFYLHPDDVRFLVDSAGNAGTTAWLDGRIVGCWIQDDDGTVRLVLRSPVSRAGRALLDREARRLTTWLGGRVVNSVYMARQRRGDLLP